jgi:hypothetical protein
MQVTSYKEKYLKYKEKYLKIKYGGVITNFNNNTGPIFTRQRTGKELVRRLPIQCALYQLTPDNRVDYNLQNPQYTSYILRHKNIINFVDRTLCPNRTIVFNYYDVTDQPLLTTPNINFDKTFYNNAILNGAYNSIPNSINQIKQAIVDIYNFIKNNRVLRDYYFPLLDILTDRRVNDNGSWAIKNKNYQYANPIIRTIPRENNQCRDNSNYDGIIDNLLDDEILKRISDHVPKIYRNNDINFLTWNVTSKLAYSKLLYDFFRKNYIDSSTFDIHMMYADDDENCIEMIRYYLIVLHIIRILNSNVGPRQINIICLQECPKKVYDLLNYFLNDIFYIINDKQDEFVNYINNDVNVIEDITFDNNVVNGSYVTLLRKTHYNYRASYRMINYITSHQRISPGYYRYRRSSRAIKVIYQNRQNNNIESIVNCHLRHGDDDDIIKLIDHSFGIYFHGLYFNINTNVSRYFTYDSSQYRNIPFKYMIGDVNYSVRMSIKNYLDIDPNAAEVRNIAQRYCAGIFGFDDTNLNNLNNIRDSVNFNQAGIFMASNDIILYNFDRPYAATVTITGEPCIGPINERRAERARANRY